MKRLPQLDFLRGIAVLLVIGTHNYVLPYDAGFLTPFSKLLKEYGWAGVDLFFALSGFLVAGLLFQEFELRGEVDVKRFLVRRVFRIWPTYFVFLAVVTIGSAATGTFHPGLLWNWIHVQNYHWFAMPDPWRTGITWSLAVEEHFYLALPALAYVAAGHGRRTWHRRILLGLLLPIVICPLLRLVHPGRVGDGFVPFLSTHLRLDGLAWGALLAYVYHCRKPWLAHMAGKAGLVAALGVAVATSQTLRVDRGALPSAWNLPILFVGVGCTLIVLGFVYLPERVFSSIPARAVVFLGRHSYSVFLFHLMVGLTAAQSVHATGVLSSAPTARWLLVMAVYVVAATLGGALVARLIEFPALRLRERLFPPATAAQSRSVAEEIVAQPVPS